MTLPLRIISTQPDDAATIQRFTPGKAGELTNSFDTLRAAGGVCRDLRPRLLDSRAYLGDARGLRVPDEAWSPELSRVRGHIR